MPDTSTASRAAWRLPRMASLFAAFASSAWAADDASRIRITLGDYRFEPSEVTVTAGRSVVLELVNKDSITPHNFTLQDAAANLDIDIDVPAGESREVSLTPTAGGSYGFHCNKKLLFCS